VTVLNAKEPIAYTVRPLDVGTWPAFARLVEANNGVWGGCWCAGFHVPVNQRAATRP
jgi:hypothetical protein